MSSGKVWLTKEGKQKLEEEKDYLIAFKRAEISEKLKTAKGFGDLSENSEYDEARNEQAQVEARISMLENHLKNSELIENAERLDGVVSIGDTVKIKDLGKNKEMSLRIVGTLEADISQNKISNESPIGKALLDSKLDQVVFVKTKANTIQYKILEIIR